MSRRLLALIDGGMSVDDVVVYLRGRSVRFQREQFLTVLLHAALMRAEQSKSPHDQLAALQRYLTEEAAFTAAQPEEKRAFIRPAMRRDELPGALETAERAVAKEDEKLRKSLLRVPLLLDSGREALFARITENDTLSDEKVVENVEVMLRRMEPRLGESTNAWLGRIQGSPLTPTDEEFVALLRGWQ